MNCDGSNTLEKGLYKLAYIYMILKGVQPDKIKSVKLSLTSPSLFAERERLATLTEKFNLLATIKGSQMFPDVWILKEIMGLSDEEIISVLGIMQAQLQGQDIVQLLTGEQNPFSSGQQQPQGGAEGELEAGLGSPVPQGAEGGAQASTGDMGLGQDMGGGEEPIPTEPQGDLAPEEEGVPQEVGGIELDPNAEQKAPSLSPTDLAIKALLALEGKNLNIDDKKNLMLEIINQKSKHNTDMQVRWGTLLELINNRTTENFNGFTKDLTVGELGGLMQEMKKNKPKKKGILTEEQLMKKARQVKKMSPNSKKTIEEFKNKIKNIYENKGK